MTSSTLAGHANSPAADRARFAEEHRSELWELAHAGQSRRQLAYSFPQLVSAPRLHAELRTPRRRRAPL